MKIFVEAYDSSAPDWIKKFLSSMKSRYSTRADSAYDFEASTAKFEDANGWSLSELRNAMKNNEYCIFALMEKGAQTTTVIQIKSDPSNKTNGLSISGPYSYEYKDKSFKYLISNALEVYITKATTDRADKRNARADSRKGIISRKGDSAQEPASFRFDYDSMMTDASGYVYDASRLSKKLASLHEGDVNYYLSSSIKTFKSMTALFAKTVTNIGEQELPFDTYTFSDTGASRIIHDGTRAIEDTMEVLNRLNADVKDYIKYYTKDAQSAGVDESTFEDGKNYTIRQCQSSYSSIKSAYKRLQKICAGEPV